MILLLTFIHQFTFFKPSATACFYKYQILLIGGSPLLHELKMRQLFIDFYFQCFYIFPICF